MKLVFGLSLVALGVLVALYAHGWWQARALAPRKAQRAAGATSGDGSDEEAITLARLPNKLRLRPRIDVLIDSVATLGFDQPTPGERIRPFLPKTWRVGTKPVLFEGLAEGSVRWELIRPGRRYRQLQAAVQLANRYGPLNELEFSEWVQMLTALSDKIEARLDVPDMIDEVGRGRELDAFAQEVDATLTLYLHARRAVWTPGYVQQRAARCGFVVGATAARMVLPGPGLLDASFAESYFTGDENDTPATQELAPIQRWPEVPTLVLKFDTQSALADPEGASIDVLELALDVPLVAQSLEPFATWKHIAQQMAADLDAEILDAQGQPLGDASFDEIGQWLQQVYALMAQHDLAAGSPLARRVFS
ncbi:cell division protein ZipA C-terminal FtsZ-binding domain-containing protein [Amphibiibacter pelophylacis]|uniref:Cell division protein ZipA C-terminal FtsZ-binding domain-containing protein n=1 Tax=Amphibiibacter pelophylacis TaxID=1799477 RepID=A0ACC6P304_9BURK